MNVSHVASHYVTKVVLFMNCVQFGRSALSHAAELGHLSIVRMMIRQFGCSVEECTFVSDRAISTAIFYRHCSMHCIDSCCDLRTYLDHRTLHCCMCFIGWMDPTACHCKIWPASCSEGIG